MAILSINGILYERVDTTENWESVNPVLGNKEKGFERTSGGVPVGWKMGNGATAWNDLSYWDTTTGIYVTISTGAGGEYTLDSGELAIVNSIGRIPNFVALVGGQQFFDVYPIYTGSAGEYTEIRVVLHGDSEDHLLQFS